MSKKHTLKSGNIFEYTHERVAGRGGLFKGEFIEPPSTSDVTEAQAMLRGLAPDGSTITVECVTRQDDPAAMDEMRRTDAAFRAQLYGGSVKLNPPSTRHRAGAPDRADPPDRTLTVRELVRFWTSRGARAERDGDAAEAERCHAAAARFLREIKDIKAAL